MGAVEWLKRSELTEAAPPRHGCHTQLRDAGTGLNCPLLGQKPAEKRNIYALILLEETVHFFYT